MAETPPGSEAARTGEIRPASAQAVDLARPHDAAPHAPGLAAAEAALATAQAYALKAAAPATLRAYRADWEHYAEWCVATGLAPVPAAPTTVGAYLASLAETHAPATIRRGTGKNLGQGACLPQVGRHGRCTDHEGERTMQGTVRLGMRAGEG